VNEQKENQDINEEPREAEDPARADYNKGKELRAAGDEAQAASFFHNALVGFEQNGDDQGVANASDQLGDICAARQNHASGL